MRGVLDVLSTFEALHAAGEKTPYDHVRNVFVFVVNSLATPPNDWSKHESPPGLFDVLMKATGTPSASAMKLPTFFLARASLQSALCTSDVVSGHRARRMRDQATRSSTFKARILTFVAIGLITLLIF